MQPIEMPAWQLTAGSIWNSFRSSGKKHLILTGTRGAGKSTLLKALAPREIPGIQTWAVPGNGVYLRELGSCQEAMAGKWNPDAQGCEKRMRIVQEGFTGLGIPALKRCMESSSPWVFLDEIGYLETDCPAYCDMIHALLDQKQVLAAVRKEEHPFLTGILGREDVFSIDLDEPFDSTGCVIMASGLGKRFGSNKLMADFGGRPLIAGVLEATQFIPHRVVVTRHADVAKYCKEQGIPVILHDLPYRSDTVHLGLEALRGTSCCMFCSGDQPLLKRDTVHALALCGIQDESRILRTCAEGEPGAPILFPAKYYPELLALPVGKGGSYLARKYPQQVGHIPVEDKKELMDVDTPEDLNDLLRASRI